MSRIMTFGTSSLLLRTTIGPENRRAGFLGFTSARFVS